MKVAGLSLGVGWDMVEVLLVVMGVTLVGRVMREGDRWKEEGVSSARPGLAGPGPKG